MPYVVVEPIFIFTEINTVFPIALYLPVIVPFPIAGFVVLAVQEGLYTVHASASDAEEPVLPVGPTDSRVIFTVLPAFTIDVPVGSVIKFSQSPTISVW